MRAAAILVGIALLGASSASAAVAGPRHTSRAPARTAPRHPPRKPLMEQARGAGLVTAAISQREAAAVRVPEL